MTHCIGKRSSWPYFIRNWNINTRKLLQQKRKYVYRNHPDFVLNKRGWSALITESVIPVSITVSQFTHCHTRQLPHWSTHTGQDSSGSSESTLWAGRHSFVSRQHNGFFSLPRQHNGLFSLPVRPKQLCSPPGLLMNNCRAWRRSFVSSVNVNNALHHTFTVV